MRRRTPGAPVGELDVVRSLLAQSRRFGPTTVLCLGVATIAVLAATASGFPVQHLNANDGGIWVTDNAAGEIGRFNKPIAQLDGTVSTTNAAPNLDVEQNGSLVAAWDRNAGRLYAVNVYTPSFSGGGVSVSAAQVALGGSTLAVLSTNQALRTATLAADGGSLDPLDSSAPARASHLPSNAAVAVGTDNSVYVAGGGKLLTFPAPGAGPQTSSAVPLPADGQWQIAAVGSVPVIADPVTRTLYLPDSGRTARLPSSDSSRALELQQSSQPSSFAVVATTQALYAVSLSTGQVTRLNGGHQGTPAAPVQVAGCIHAAWNAGDSGRYLRTCGGVPPASMTSQSFSLSSASPSLVFRVNHGEVVLNDTADGGVFLLDPSVMNAKPDWQLRQLTKKKTKNSTPPPISRTRS